MGLGTTAAPWPGQPLGLLTAVEKHILSAPQFSVRSQDLAVTTSSPKRGTGSAKSSTRGQAVSKW